MDEDVYHGKPYYASGRVGESHAPGKAGKKHEEGKEVGEGWVRTVPCVLRF